MGCWIGDCRTCYDHGRHHVPFGLLPWTRWYPCSCTGSAVHVAEWVREQRLSLVVRCALV